MKTNPELDPDMFDVIDYLEDRGIDYATAGSKNVSAGWIGLSCPECGDNSTHLGVNLETKRWSCFRCGKKGNPIRLIMMLDGCGYHQAAKVFHKFIAKDFTHLIRKERIHSEMTMFPAGTSDKFLPIHDKFLESRRYDRKFLQHKYDILAVGPTCDSWKFRIIIPVYLDQELVTYIGRDTTGKQEIPYKNAPAEKCKIDVKDCLLGIDNVGDTAILVEGVLDAWRIGTGAIPTFGTQVTDNQIALLKRKNIKRAVILFDADATKKGEALAYAVSSVVDKIEHYELTEGDPDNLTEDEVWELRREIFK